MNENNTFKSVYRRGADDGFILGIYLSVMLIATFYSVSGPNTLSGLVAFAMAVGVPVLIFFFIRRGYRADHCNSRFSAMWLHGICIFFFGSLLMALTAYVYMRLINPTFIPDLFETARQAYVEIGSKDAMFIASTIERMQKANAYPTPAGIAVEIIMMAVFTGSILSMLLSLIIRALTSKKQ